MDKLQKLVGVLITNGYEVTLQPFSILKIPLPFMSRTELSVPHNLFNPPYGLIWYIIVGYSL